MRWRSPMRLFVSFPTWRFAGRLGGAAHAAVEPWLAAHEEYASCIRELVDAIAPG
jgi:hypothetical protein